MNWDLSRYCGRYLLACNDSSTINCYTYHQSSFESAFIFLGLLSCTLYTKGLTSSTMRFFQSPLVLEAGLVLKYANEYYVKFMPCGKLKPYNFLQEWLYKFGERLTYSENGWLLICCKCFVVEIVGDIIALTAPFILEALKLPKKKWKDINILALS